MEYKTSYLTKILGTGLILAGSMFGNADNLEAKVNRHNHTATSKKENKEKQSDNKYKTNDFSKDSDEVLMARMLFGEARGCSDEEEDAIAYTAINRANDGKKWNGETIKQAILCPYQYSCFNKNDPNYEKLKDPYKYDKESFDRCLKNAREILAGNYKELNLNQTHYHAKNCSPKWAKSKNMQKIGHIKNSKHIFYREK